MTKVIPITRLKLLEMANRWISIDEELPPGNLKVSFYNKFFDEERLCTLDDLEANFRYLRNELSDVLENLSENESFYIDQTFHPTHWRLRTPPPE